MSFKSRLSRIEQKMGQGSDGFCAVGIPESAARMTDEEQNRFLANTYPELEGFNGLKVLIVRFAADPEGTEWQFIKRYKEQR